mmetsp:Transcript_7619/g.19410  ORF Transcript_7619/g.19410 Transcript_7619/m.19410 type:complete len:123 (+) Transcript_7619:25-393(+)
MTFTPGAPGAPGKKGGAAAAVASAVGGIAGTFALAFGGLLGVTGVFTGVSRAMVVHHKKKAGHVCYLCEGRKYVECRTCSGKKAIDWQPIAGAKVARICVCPTCGGKTGLQKCLNCVGLGYA